MFFTATGCSFTTSHKGKVRSFCHGGEEVSLGEDSQLFTKGSDQLKYQMDSDGVNTKHANWPIYINLCILYHIIG